MLLFSLGYKKYIIFHVPSKQTTKILSTCCTKDLRCVDFFFACFLCVCGSPLEKNIRNTKEMTVRVNMAYDLKPNMYSWRVQLKEKTTKAWVTSNTVTFTLSGQFGFPSRADLRVRQSTATARSPSRVSTPNCLDSPSADLLGETELDCLHCFLPVAEPLCHV